MPVRISYDVRSPPPGSAGQIDAGQQRDRGVEQLHLLQGLWASKVVVGMPVHRELAMALLEPRGCERERQVHQRKRTLNRGTHARSLRRRADPLPAFPDWELYSPERMTPSGHTPGLIHRSKQVAKVVARERDAADVVLEPLVTDFEASLQGPDLSPVGDRDLPERPQLVVVSLEDAVIRHG